MITPKHFVDKIKRAATRSQERTGPFLQWMEEFVDDTRLRQPSYNFDDGPPSQTAHLNDLVRGLIVITGLPNAGKSTWIVHNSLALLQRNPDTVVVDISHDDDVDKRYVQWISNLTGLTYMDISSGRSALNNAEKKAIADAEAQIYKWIEEERLYPYESTEDIMIEATGKERTISLAEFPVMFAELKRIRSIHPNKKIIVFVDAWNDMNISGTGDDYGEANKRVAEIKQFCRQYNIILVMSAHLKKVAGKTPTLEDISGSNKLGYEALWAMVVRNQVRDKVKNPLILERDGMNYEVLAAEIPKSKVGGWASFNMYWAMPMAVARLLPVYLDEYKYLDDQYKRSRK